LQGERLFIFITPSPKHKKGSSLQFIVLQGERLPIDPFFNKGQILKIGVSYFPIFFLKYPIPPSIKRDLLYHL